MKHTLEDSSIGRVNESVVRLVGGFVALITIVLLITHNIWIPVYLAVDFFLRAFTTLKSPLALISREIAKAFRLKPEWIFAAPKKFAALVGFLFSVSIAALLYLNLGMAADVVAIVLLVCAVLESAFSICLGCYFFDWFIAPIQNRLNR
jgi:hypothetical protein